MFSLPCPQCGKERVFSSKSILSTAIQRGSTCKSCRTTNCNKKRQPKNGSLNATWKGCNAVPGKTLSKLKNGAKNRRIEVHITVEDISRQYEAQGRKCALTGIPVFFGENASVDRIDSDKHYTTDNIQILHKLVNIMKRDISQKDFISMCYSVVNNCKEPNDL